MGPLSLGPFRLERPIGRGGMAEVWLGVHRAQQQRVAVKVLTGDRAREDAFIRALKNEIHNVARLHHPGVILLFDTGEVDVETERVTEGRMLAGSPWFAMELASHGSLSPKRLPLPWSTTRMLLLSLLDALAHAHARGVIHRDIKPGNILLCAPDDPRPGLKLTDFGIAAPYGASIDGDAEAGRLSGTPRYMAPEQFQAKWRDFGPWTDLYAIGCLAYQLAVGNAPFSGDPHALAVAHCHDAPALPRPTHEDYPAGFDAWVMRLLEKEPSRRFASAADAAWALLRLQSARIDDEPTVVAGWEEALRTLKPLADPVDDAASGDTFARAAGERGADELDPGSSSHVAQGGDSQLISTERLSPHPPSAEVTNTATLVDRPAAFDRSRASEALVDPTVRKPRPGLVSGSSEATAGATRSMRGREGVGIDELFPLIPPDARRDRPEESQDVERALVDTTFSPNAPWTELAALSPKESLPTMSSRASPALGSRRAAAVDESQLAPRVPPPMPPTWRRPGPQAPVLHLLGAGLGLYGLRQIPMVDRDNERDLLWETLSAVHEGRGARVVVIRGPSGIGKTRLAEWLVERAAEVGAGVGLRAGHGPNGGPLDGLAGMIAIHARTTGLRRKALVRRLHELVRRQGLDDIEETLALAELLRPSRDPPTPRAMKADGEADDPSGVFEHVEEGREAERIALESADERHRVALRYLVRASVERPVVAWLDDVQWGADGIAFARHLLRDEGGAGARIMLVLSASEEELAARPFEAQALDELIQQPRVVELRLPHLPEREHRALVGELLGLEEQLAQTVAARTAGNPLFAVQLVGDFVSRGVLDLTPRGFALRDGELAVLPDDVHDVWSERVARVLARTPPRSQAALELGSVLGTSGDDGEWQALCDDAGVELPPELIDELLVARLLVPDDVGLRFAHAMLRESVLRAAAEAGRLSGHHRSAARMLRRRYGDRHRGVAERIGRHLVLAGDVAEALPYLLRAAAETARTATFQQAHMILGERDASLDRLGLPENDVRRAEGWALKASLLTDEGRLDEAQVWAEQVLRLRNDPGFAQVAAQALRVLALVAEQQTRWEDAARFFAEGRGIAERIGDRELTAQCISGLADTAYDRGRLDDAGALYSLALEVCQEHGDEAGMAMCLWNLAYVSLWRGEFDAAREMLLRQQKIARRIGHRTMVANGKNALGDLERFTGRYDDAELRYDDALRQFDAIGSGKRRTVRVNLALNALGRGLLERARARAEAVLPELSGRQPALTALCHGILAAVAAHHGQWAVYDEHVRVIAANRPERELIDADGAWLFEIIGDHARSQADDERAAFAYENALELWRMLGRSDRVDGVERALGKLGTVRSLRRR